MADKKYYYALGRRKTAVATVRLYEGKDDTTVNEKPLSKVYSSEVEIKKLMQPFIVAELDPKKFYFTARTQGGGTSAQLEAIRHAIARCLIKMNPDLRKPIKQAGYLTRDPRMVERKKPGLRKARRAEQFSKR